MALYKLVELRLLYMRQKIEGPLGKKVEEVGPECADNLVKFVLGSRHVPVDEAAMIHEQVCKSLLEESQQKRVLEAVDMRINKIDRNGSKTEIRYPERYQSKACWDVYAHEVSVELRLMTGAKRLKALGGTKFSERTFAEAAIIALTGSGQQWTDTQALAHTRRIKQLYDTIPLELYPEGGPSQYPADPENRKTAFQNCGSKSLQMGSPSPPSTTEQRVR